MSPAMSTELSERFMRKRRKSLCGLIVCLGAATAGCWQDNPPPASPIPSYKGITLTVGALDQPALLEGVTSQRGEWVASRGGQIEVRPGPLTPGSAGEVDVLLFPGSRLGDLIDAGRLQAIPNEAVMPPPPPTGAGADETEPAPGASASTSAPDAEGLYDYMGISPAYRDKVTRYGNERMALPYGASVLVLAYRRDAFQREANRSAASAKGIQLEPPRTWEELDALARFFEGTDWDGDGQPGHGIALALGDDSEGLGNATFLARAASLGQHPDQFSFEFDSGKMEPRIASEPFVEALAGLIALKSAGPPGMERFDAAAARQAFHDGKAAMLIDRAERAAAWSNGKHVSVAQLPGSTRVFDPGSKAWMKPEQRNAPSYLPTGGGWLIGIRAGLSGTQKDAAIDLAKYLSNPENSSRIRAERAFPMTPFRTAIVSQGLADPTSAPDVDTRLWAQAVGRTLAERPVVGLRIPAADEYHRDLAAGRKAAAAGKEPRAALANVARAWSERSKTLGPMRQRWHYQRSLNLRTSSEPPAPGT